jgi:hypothetical protein
MLIAKTNISIGDYYFDKGSEVILPKELIGRVRGLCDEVPGKSTECEEVPEVKEKLMKTDMMKDKKLKSYKNK